MWDEWIYVPGLPPKSTNLDFSTEALSDSTDLAEAYIFLSGTESPENYLDYTNYLYSQKLAFAQIISNSDSVDANLMALIDQDLNLTLSETNPFVKNEWYIAGIRNGYEPVMEPAYKWLGQQGRHAFVTSTFKALVNDAKDCETAEAWYADYYATYNSYVQWRVDGVMEACSAAADEEDTTTTAEPVSTEEPAADTTSPPMDEPAPEPAPSSAVANNINTGILATMTFLIVAISI
jgi:Leukotriene A4 hydrolase, C-terminal